MGVVQQETPVVEAQVLPPAQYVVPTTSVMYTSPAVPTVYHQYAPVTSVAYAPASGVAYAPATGVAVPEATTVVLAPPVQADYVVMNGKTYASMEEAMQDYCAGAAAGPVSSDAPVVETAPSEGVQQSEE